MTKSKLGSDVKGDSVKENTTIYTTHNAPQHNAAPKMRVYVEVRCYPFLGRCNKRIRVMNLHENTPIHPDAPLIHEPQAQNLRGQKLEEHMKHTVFTPLMKAVVVGCVLGDGHLHSSGKHYGMCLKVEQKASNAPYVDALYAVFAPMVGTPPQVYTKNGKEHRNPSYSALQSKPVYDGLRSYWFRTYRSTHLAFFAKVFYTMENGARRKIVPKLIHRWMTAVSLAVWYMDDGTKTRSSYVLNTHCFYVHEQKLLQKMLGTKFGLQTSLQKDTKFMKLYIGVESRVRFEELISPHVVPCMRYKLHASAYTKRTPS
jgi:hypothetical protein